MINNLLLQLQYVFAAMQANVPYCLMIIGGLLAIHILNALLGYRLNLLGIRPRRFSGLIGIPFSSFLHADFNHLFFNSIPLFVLTNFLLIGGIPKFILITITIILCSGIAVWLFGRKGIHIGASGLAMGYWGYLLVNAYLYPSIMTVILAVICLYYFGGLLFSLFPGGRNESWEGHVFGFLSGLLAFYLFR